jgi:N-acetylneuraminate synthase/N,N'-diacetyllegionaminate synthase
MTQPTPIVIGKRTIGPGHPCYLVAEIGINHNGDLELAKTMIQAASAAGADAVKFQNYRTEDFLSDRSLTYTYTSQGRQVTESQWDMFKRCELTSADLVQLKEACDRCGVGFHSTPTSEGGVRELVALGSDVLKNGSDYLGHLPLIRCMARSGCPTVLSTGMATLADIDDAVRAFRGAGGRELVLLHCTSAYPTPPGEVNLRKMNTLMQAFGCLAGLSDHTDGIEAAIGAVALGACWIEKHFTTDRTLPGPDQRFSADPAGFAALAASVRRMEQELGSGVVGPTATEEGGRRDFRLSCVAARPLAIGAVLTASDVAFRRPGTGLAPKDAEWLIGQRLALAVAKGDVYSPCHFAGGTQ